jgi:CBS domain-containing protein
MQIKDLLDQKRGTMISVPPGTVIPGAAVVLAKQSVGAAIIAGPDAKILGILSERDITRAVAEHGAKIAEMPVEALMVEDVITCGAATNIAEAMNIMQVNHIRHLPVVEEDGRAIGIISMRDMMEVCVGDMMSMGMTG